MKKLAALALPLFFSTASHAFGLGDHKRITQQAVAEFNQCFPGLISGTDELVLWASDLEEDTNILRKDLFYSHFYNPYKQLRMRRKDSSVRVGMLEAAIREDVADGDRGDIGTLVHMGHVIHHLQDMASPPHVVPVMHWLTDGFERYKFAGDISSGMDCGELVTRTETDLEDVLSGTAKATLGYVASERLELLSGAPGSQTHLVVSGDAFWQASQDDQFGQYGYLGNNYGQDSFTEEGVRYEVPAGFYAGFKQRQMKLAVQATKKAFYWLLVAHGI